MLLFWLERLFTGLGRPTVWFLPLESITQVRRRVGTEQWPVVSRAVCGCLEAPGPPRGSGKRDIGWGWFPAVALWRGLLNIQTTQPPQLHGGALDDSCNNEAAQNGDRGL